MSNLRPKLYSFFKALAASLLVGITQTTPIIGFYGFMVAPLLIYLVRCPTGYQFVFEDVFEIFRIDGPRLFGGIIFYLGLVVFCVALLQWFSYRNKNFGLFAIGLYSKIRHPQFLGIIIMTLGLTVKELTISTGWGLMGVPFATTIPVGVTELVGLWFLQVLGYIAFAVIEERGLSKKFGEYEEYRRKVPLLLPIKNPRIIPEILFTVLLIVGLCILLFLVPYDLIRVFSYRYIPVM